MLLKFLFQALTDKPQDKKRFQNAATLDFYYRKVNCPMYKLCLHQITQINRFNNKLLYSKKSKTSNIKKDNQKFF